MKKQKVSQTKQDNTVLDDLKNQLARCMADYANLQKRTDEERKVMFKLASITFINKILPIIDNLKNAQNHLKDSGIAMIIGQFDVFLKEEGFDEVKVNLGDKFDENTMEVVEAIETQKEMDNNSVSEVVLTGVRYNDGSIVRHAKVKVYKYALTDQKNEQLKNNVESEELK